jgi:hypothetical protein
MNDVNPYESPSAEAAPPKPNDPLAFPATGFFASSILAFLLGLHLLGEVFIVRRLAILSGRDPDVGSGMFGALGWAAWVITVSFMAFVCARCLQKRRWRWYVIAFSLFTFFPPTGFLMVPLGVLTLVRLRQKRVWNSF